jgi:hypothetical protein
MAMKVVIEFPAKPGARAELKRLLESISATHGPRAPGFLGSTVYDALDNPDGLVEMLSGIPPRHTQPPWKGLPLKVCTRLSSSWWQLHSGRPGSASSSRSIDEPVSDRARCRRRQPASGHRSCRPTSSRRSLWVACVTRCPVDGSLWLGEVTNTWRCYACAPVVLPRSESVHSVHSGHAGLSTPPGGATALVDLRNEKVRGGPIGRISTGFVKLYCPVVKRAPG